MAIDKSDRLYSQNLLEVIKAGPILSRYIIQQVCLKPYLKFNPKKFWLEEEINKIPPLIPKNTNLTDEEWIDYLDKILLYDDNHIDHYKIDIHWLTYNKKKKRSEIKSYSLNGLVKKFGRQITTKMGKHPILLWYYHWHKKLQHPNKLLEQDQIIFKFRPDLQMLLNVLMT
jgi:hypothetical protein